MGGEVQSPAEAEPSHTSGRHTLLPVVWKATPEHAVEGISVHRLYRTPPQPSKTLIPSNAEHEQWRAFLYTDRTEPLRSPARPLFHQGVARRRDEPLLLDTTTEIKKKK